MNSQNPISTQGDLDSYFGGFHNLMPYRVQHILLVSSLYESFIIEEDGLVNELITSEYMDMNLTHAPKVTSVATGREALEFIKSNPVDLVITMMRLGTWYITRFADEVKAIRPALPVVVLAGEHSELIRQGNPALHKNIDRAFTWNGDAKILLAIIKLVEDHQNAEHDAKVGNVRVILLVENSVRFYSTYLPLIYTELVKLTQSLMAEGINLMQRLLRMRARPKILLAENFEDAWELYQKFDDNLLGIISDIRFPRQGKLYPKAGLELARRIKEQSEGLPILLQSSDVTFKKQALALGAAFVNKRSPNLLTNLRDFLSDSLGFGDFVFHLPDGMEVGRVHDLRSFEEMIRTVPAECLEYHALRNHFSNWLMARTEFELAMSIRPKKVTDFSTLEELRQYLLNALNEFRERSQGSVIADFSAKMFEATIPFARIGGGSMGGKGRGLAFIRTLLRRYNLRHRFENVLIFVPRSAVIGADVFDTYMDKNKLHGLVAEDRDDNELARSFTRARLPSQVHTDLKVFLHEVHYPLAVRSSSLLEDSLDRPFAGIYTTHMLPNNHKDLRTRLRQLSTAIKFVYASTFFSSAKRYLESTDHHPEEEKMAVVLQEVVGSTYGPRFYPTFSGVVRSYNFYPTGNSHPEEGVACVALGLGRIVVEGGECLMFSPAHPNVLPQFATSQDWLSDSQRHFYAVDISHPSSFPSPDGTANLLNCRLDVAETDGTLAPIGSVYSPENDRIHEGIHRPGTRLVTFAHLLKHNLIPLAEILQTLLSITRDAMACPIEIEFAVDMGSDPIRFGILQARPIITDAEFENVAIAPYEAEQALCYSEQVMGNGRTDGVRDIIYVKPNDFDSAFTREIASEIGMFNEKLRQSNRGCVLIGPGRWGCADRWLGIPVTWDQISTARAIVETTAPDFVIKPSQGTHFFQNLTSLRVAYLTVHPTAGKGLIDWDWLTQQSAAKETRFLRHLRLNKPVLIKLDGRCRCGIILKPNHNSA